MRRRRWVISLVFVLIAVYFSTTVLASFSYFGSNVTQSYNTGEIVRGKINLSFQNEPVYNKITTNFDGEITVLNFLEVNGYIEGIEYNCSTPGCIADYAIQETASAISASPKIKVIGFKLTGEINSIDDVGFKINSNAAPSCGSGLQVKIPGEDLDFYILAEEHSGVSCGTPNFGCFNQQASLFTNKIIDNNGYCENISLPSSPAFKIGAVIKNSTSGTDNLIMEIYNSEWDILDECYLPKNRQSMESLSCNVNVSATSNQDYFVCVRSESSDASYQIRKESIGQLCGFYLGASGDLGASISDYEIFAQPIRFEKHSILADSETMYLDETLLDKINAYISEKYQNSCPKDGCFIPFEVNANFSTNIYDAFVKYSNNDGIEINNELYLLKEEEPTLSTGKLSFDLAEGKFFIPLDSNENKLRIYIGGQSVLPQSIDLSIKKGFGFDISPRLILIGVNTKFVAITSQNITYSRWVFGPNEEIESTNKEAIYKYNLGGEFEVEVELENNKGATSKKTFSVIVGQPKESAQWIINKYTTRIANLSRDLLGYPDWIKESIDTKIDLAGLNSTLTQEKINFQLATTDEEYADVVNSLISLDIPYKIASTKSGKVPMSIGFDSINLAIGEEITGKEAADKEQYKNSLLNWINENYRTEIEFEEIKLLKDTDDENLLTRFKIDISSKGDQTYDGNAYLIIDYPLNLIEFKEDYGANAAGEATYVQFAGSETVEFTISSIESIKARSLRVYISPENPTQLGGLFGVASSPDKGFPWIIFLVSLLILIIFVLIVYIILQEWYKKNYQMHLFRNPDDLYNLINFVYNSRRVGLKDGEITDKLKKNSWTGEQISYTIKKLEGKRTGMWEIPIMRPFEMKKVNAEIAKRSNLRSGTPPRHDGRFIKHNTL